MSDVTQRFSTRVGNYALYRPGYPPQVLDILARRCGLQPSSRIADVGSGTGILSRLFLDHGCDVWGVEPNAPMRQAAEQALASRDRFHSVDGRAEATTLPDACVDLVTAGQAAHWFDGPAAHREFARILRPGGYVVLMWNSRQIDTTPFLRDYEHLLQTHGTDYTEVCERRTDAQAVQAFFGETPFDTAQVPSEQVLDWSALKGRVESSSYTPEAGHPQYEPLMAELRRIWDAHQQDGQVRLLYDTRLYFGRL